MANVACKYRIYPTDAQKEYIAKNIGHNRWWWNYCIREVEAHYEAHKEDEDKKSRHISAMYQIARRLPQLKKDEDTSWLAEADATSLIYTAENVDKAYEAFFKKLAQGLPVSEAGKPHTHRKQNKGTFTKVVHKDSEIDHKNNCIFMSSKIKDAEGNKESWVKAVLHRKIDGKPKKVTFTRDIDGRYYASVCFEIEDETKTSETPTLDKTLGIDLTIMDMGAVYCSNGERFFGTENAEDVEKKIERMEKHLKKWQRIADKRRIEKKGVEQSKGYREAMRKCSVIQAKITRIKDYNTHMITSKLTRDDRYSAIAMESLNVAEMVEKKEDNDTKLKQRRRKSKAVRNRSARMGMVSTQMEYKAKREGKTFVRVDTYYPSSQICSKCGYVNPEAKDETVWEWRCPKCGEVHHRKYNAALNIQREGFRILTEEKEKAKK